MEVSVVIPNYNGIAFLDSVLASLEGQTLKNFEVIFVDNGSSDGSCSFVAGNYPWVHIIELPENNGFCKAVNEGIKASRAPYVLPRNNDTEVKEDFLEEMVAAIRRHKRAFSCAARMVQYHDRDRLDDAGNFYNALGWSFARGWKIRISDTVQGSTATRTGMRQRRSFTMWEAARADPGIIISRPDILQETTFI